LFHSCDEFREEALKRSFVVFAIETPFAITAITVIAAASPGP